MNGIVSSPRTKQEFELEHTKEKKKVVIKDVLGDMKSTIHAYHDNKDKIDKNVEQSGKKF